MTRSSRLDDTGHRDEQVEIRSQDTGRQAGRQVPLVGVTSRGSLSKDPLNTKAWIKADDWHLGGFRRNGNNEEKMYSLPPISLSIHFCLVELGSTLCFLLVGNRPPSYTTSSKQELTQPPSSLEITCQDRPWGLILWRWGPPDSVTLGTEKSRLGHRRWQ